MSQGAQRRTKNTQEGLLDTVGTRKDAYFTRWVLDTMADVPEVANSERAVFIHKQVRRLRISVRRPGGAQRDEADERPSTATASESVSQAKQLRNPTDSHQGATGTSATSSTKTTYKGPSACRVRFAILIIRP